MILFDASAIMNLLREGRVEVLLQGCTIDLAGCGLGNAVRRHVKVERTLANSDGVELLKALQDVMSAMESVQVTSLVRVLENAIQENLSVYDASYLTAAVEGRHQLATDDKDLLQAARKYRDASRSSDLA